MMVQLPAETCRTERDGINEYTMMHSVLLPRKINKPTLQHQMFVYTDER